MDRRLGAVRIMGNTRTRQLSSALWITDNHTIAKTKDCLAVPHGAVAACHGGEPDHQQPPDGQGEGQPDGDGVDHDGEVVMKE